MLNGPTAQYLGRGDLHEPKYSHLGIHSKLEDLNGFKIADSMYTGPAIDTSGCPLVFHVYPSSMLEEDYTTNNAMYFMFGSIGIFLFTAIIFVVYDMSVERRQKVVLTTAQKTSAVVSSLFPEAVRDRLYEETNAKAAANNNKNKPPSFLAGENTLADASSELRPYSTAPIAELYPDTTVMFCDIAGTLYRIMLLNKF